MDIYTKGLVILAGMPASGKTTLRDKILKTPGLEHAVVISLDELRAKHGRNQSDQSATGKAVEEAHRLLEEHLSANHLVVWDATSLIPEHRKTLLDAAKKHRVHSHLIVLNTNLEKAKENDAYRKNQNQRYVGEEILEKMSQNLEKTLQQVHKENYDTTDILTWEDLQNLQVVSKKLPFDHEEKTGPFDIIGDVHGTYTELKELIEKLGHKIVGEHPNAYVETHGGRTLLFLGDLTDRGNENKKVLSVIHNTYKKGNALVVKGNHDDKLLRYLKGNPIKINDGMEKTIEELENDPQFKETIKNWLATLPCHIILDGGKLVAAHAGLDETLQGRIGKKPDQIALYGNPSGVANDRRNFAADYKGEAFVVYGHYAGVKPVETPHSICLDTGSVFGNTLTALKWPEKTITQVQAKDTYTQSEKWDQTVKNHKAQKTLKTTIAVRESGAQWSL